MNAQIKQQIHLLEREAASFEDSIRDVARRCSEGNEKVLASWLFHEVRPNAIRILDQLSRINKTIDV